MTPPPALKLQPLPDPTALDRKRGILCQLRADLASLSPDRVATDLANAQERFRKARVRALVEPGAATLAESESAKMVLDDAFERQSRLSSQERILRDAIAELEQEIAAADRADQVGRTVEALAGIDARLAARADDFRQTMADLVVRHLLRGGQPPDLAGLALLVVGPFGPDPYAAATDLCNQASATASAVRGGVQ